MKANRLDREQAILELFITPQSVPSLARRTGIPQGTVFNIVTDMLKDGRIEFAGTEKNPSPWGGQPIRLFRITTGKPSRMDPKEPDPMPERVMVRRIESTARVYWKPKRGRTHSGSGQIAGPIVIGRGSKWGAGLV